MGALAGLVDKGLVAPDWAEALAPVDDQIAAMGRFLRAELAAGRPYLPAGDAVLRAFQRPLAEVRVLVVGQDPYPTPGHPIGLSFAVARDVRPLPGSLRNIYQEIRTDLGVEPPAHGDLTAWTEQGVMLLNRVLTVRPGRAGQPPRPRVGGGHLVRDRRPGRPGRAAAPRSSGDATRSRSRASSGRSRGSASAHPSPLSAQPGLLRVPPLQPGRPAAAGPGRRAGGVGPRMGINLKLQLLEWT